MIPALSRERRDHANPRSAAPGASLSGALKGHKAIAPDRRRISGRVPGILVQPHHCGGLGAARQAEYPRRVCPTKRDAFAKSSPALNATEAFTGPDIVPQRPRVTLKSRKTSTRPETQIVRRDFHRPREDLTYSLAQKYLLSSLSICQPSRAIPRWPRIPHLPLPHNRQLSLVSLTRHCASESPAADRPSRTKRHHRDANKKTRSVYRSGLS